VGDARGETCRRCLLALGLGSGGTAAEAAPERVGAFRVLDTLASAAGTLTCLAEDGEGQPVTLQMLDPAEAADPVRARLEAEGARLGRVSHPGVVTRLEVADSGDGQLWIATDWVPGVPVTELCDRECLTIPQRLELMVEVCDALEHAHAAGVLHLDLRPSRVLVTVEQGRPRARIVGCGIARALNQGLSEDVLYATAGVPGEDLAHTAPERLESSTTPDARTDVYALGAILYELLTGALPFELRRLRRARWDQILHILREERPARPSAHVASLAPEVSSAAAAQRRLEPRTWTRALRGDLDWIVLKALEKDPAARHPSARALGEDLERYLRGEPVDPGLRSVGRRLSRLFRR
jgi:serine/threonine protein kinase